MIGWLILRFVDRNPDQSARPLIYWPKPREFVAECPMKEAEI